MNTLLIKGLTSVFLIGGLLVGGGLVQAQVASDSNSTTKDIRQQIETLQGEVLKLQSQLRAKQAGGRVELEQRQNYIKDRLRQGDQGVDVRRLQELLATDSEIYPDALVTGFYGPLTSSAVARLQTRMGLPSDGNVDKATLLRLNALIDDETINSGVIPPGLLQKVSRATATSNVGNLNIDDLPISEELKERLQSFLSGQDSVSKYNRTGQVQGARSELSIEVEILDVDSRVKIIHRNGSETGYLFRTTDRDQVIEEIVAHSDLTEAEIRRVVEFKD